MGTWVEETNRLILELLDSRSETENTQNAFHAASCTMDYAFSMIFFTMKSLILAQDER